MAVAREGGEGGWVMAISVGKLGRSSAGSVGYRVGVDSIGDAEREAFERLYREFLPRVAGYVRRHIHDYELVDEIVQETLLRAYRHGLHLEEGDEHWRWLSTVARNLCIDRRALHRNWRERAVEEPETLDLTVHESDPEAHVVAAERQEIVARALERLSERERRLLVQKHVEGRRVREMASLEGIHVEALKSALRRARAALRESYEEVANGGRGVASMAASATAALARGLRATYHRATGSAAGGVQSLTTIGPEFANSLVSLVALGTLAVAAPLLASGRVPAPDSQAELATVADTTATARPGVTAAGAAFDAGLAEIAAPAAEHATASPPLTPPSDLAGAAEGDAEPAPPPGPSVAVDDTTGGASADAAGRHYEVDLTPEKHEEPDGTTYYSIEPLRGEGDYDGDGEPDSSTRTPVSVGCPPPDERGIVTGVACPVLLEEGEDDSGSSVPA